MSPPRRILGELWQHEKQGVIRRCLLVAAAAGAEEVRVLEQQSVVLSEICPDRVTAIRRTEQIRRDYEAQGWVRSFAC